MATRATVPLSAHDWLDSELVLVLVDEFVDYLEDRPSPATKKAGAFSFAFLISANSVRNRRFLAGEYGLMVRMVRALGVEPRHFVDTGSRYFVDSGSHGFVYSYQHALRAVEGLSRTGFEHLRHLFFTLGELLAVCGCFPRPLLRGVR